MSRVGKNPIKIQNGVTITVNKDNLVTVKGAKGELTQSVDRDFKITIEESQLVVERPSEQKHHKAKHGLYRSLIANCVEGVTTGFQKQMELVGVGYKAVAQNNVLELSLGYSHSIFFQVPQELTVSAETAKGKNPIVTVQGIDKGLVGEVCAKIKSLRKVEPFKGKGIRFVGEEIRRKAGKTAAK